MMKAAVLSQYFRAPKRTAGQGGVALKVCDVPRHGPSISQMPVLFDGYDNR
jgi:hypothetical protein